VAAQQAGLRTIADQDALLVQPLFALHLHMQRGRPTHWPRPVYVEPALPERAWLVEQHQRAVGGSEQQAQPLEQLVQRLQRGRMGSQLRQ